MSVPGTCINLALAAIIVGAVNVAIDVVTLLLPAHAVWHLQLEKRWKIQIIGIFLLGGLWVFYEARQKFG